MTISTIRKVRDQDTNRVEASAARFAKRHNIDTDGHDSAFEAVQLHVDYLAEIDNDGHLASLWQRCFCRALGQPYDSRLCIAFGYIGVSID